MAELVVSARNQLLAIAWLRWRLFANAFGRRMSRSSVAGLLLIILLRMMMCTVSAVVAVGPIFGSGFIAWNEVAAQRPQSLPLLLAGVFIVWQFLSVNGLSVAASASSFDPSSLARFPVPFGRYVVLRTLFGLLTPSTIVGCLMLLASAIGMSIADQALTLPALVVLAVYAWTNIFFMRMLAAWSERWFANRRFREIFGLVMTLFVLGPQLLLLSRASSDGHAAQWFRSLPLASTHFLRWLPPGLAVHAIYVRGHASAAAAQFLALLAWTALFLSAFVMRLHKQFLGEYLSEGRRVGLKQVSPRSTASRAEPKRGSTFIPPVITACLRKEWFDMAGANSQLTALLTPLLFVVLLSRGLFRLYPRFFLPGAIGYVLIGFFPSSTTFSAQMAVACSSICLRLFVCVTSFWLKTS